MAKKSCKKGYYYCYASKKCKKIPMGYVVGMGGWLRKEKEEDETEGKKKNGNGANGDGSGSGDSNGGSDGGGVSEGWSAKYKKSINCDNPKGFSQRAHCQGKKKMTEGKEGDHEVSMAKSQLKKSAENIAKLRKVLKKKTDKDNLPAWVQAKITDTEHNTDAAAGYMEEGKRDGKSAKDKGYSLRDWFKGGGWVQAGGKYDGKPCAKQPGQKTKPFCRDADDRANMSKKERSRRAAKKRREDPNPNRKGKAKMVTDNYSNWREDLQQLDEFIGGQPGDGYIGHPRLGIKNPISPPKKETKVAPKSKGLAGRLGNRATEIERMLKNSYESEDQVVEGRYSGGGGLRPTDRIKMGDGSLKSLKDIDAKLKEKNTKKEEVQMEGKKDACYHKVKSRYSVWPSAYASGALVKCRKVGAKNWGNKTKKESIDYNLNDEYIEENIIRVAKTVGPIIKALGKLNTKSRKKLPPINLKKLSPERRKEIMYQAQKRIKSYKPGEIDKSASRKYAADRLNTVYSRRQDILKKGGSPKEAAAQSISSMGPSDPLGKDFNIRRGGRGRRGAHGPQTDRGKGNKAARRSGQEVVDTGNIKVHYRPTRDQSIQSSRDKRAMKAMERRLNKTLNLNNSYEFSNWRDDFQAMEFESIDIIKAEPLKPTDGIGSRMLGEAKKCWKGYEKKGTKKMFGKTYNNCVKKEEVEIQEAIPGYEKYDSAMKSIRKKNLSGRIKIDALKAAAALRPKTEKEVMGEDWQRSNRKDGVDGMSQKSVDAYKRENPGSKLQTAVTEKKPTGKRAKRRKSFCSRSKGQKDMHNIDCTKTPDKKICKARKRWRC